MVVKRISLQDKPPLRGELPISVAPAPILIEDPDTRDVPSNISLSLTSLLIRSSEGGTGVGFFFFGEGVPPDEVSLCAEVPEGVPPEDPFIVEGEFFPGGGAGLSASANGSPYSVSSADSGTRF